MCVDFNFTVSPSMLCCGLYDGSIVVFDLGKRDPKYGKWVVAGADIGEDHGGVLALGIGDRPLPQVEGLAVEHHGDHLIVEDRLVAEHDHRQPVLLAHVAHHAVLEVDLTAAFRLTRGVTHPMMRRRFGRIINITSIVGVTGNPGQANYAASKAGVVAMSKSLAYEVATRGITVNCVAPGFITTAMTDKLTDDQKSRILTQVPAGRMGTAGEIAAAALYLASEEAAYMTGATLHVNGGMAML